MELEELSIPLPPPSPFQNRNHEENSISLNDCPNEGQVIVEQSSSAADNETITESLSGGNNSNEQMISNSDNWTTKEESIDNTIKMKQTNDCNENESQMTITTPLIVSDEEFLNKEIEVTLQSLNDELDRMDSNDRSESSLSESMEDSKTIKTNNELNSVLNNENYAKVNSNNTNVSPEVKELNERNCSEFEAIKIKFEKKQSSTSPTPRVIIPLNESIEENEADSKNQLPITTNGKTTLFINNNQTPTPRPFSPPTSSASPSPTNEDKASITEEVRQICRPRVRLTNFSIGSYKKEVDIFESTPVTAPVKSSTKSFVTFPSVKKEENASRPSRTPLNQVKSKVEITSNSMTAMTTTISKSTNSTTPVIQTLITSAPKISRIQSWSGQKSVCLQEKNIKLPIKTNERYVSQISITKDVNNVSLNSDKQSNEDLRSPHLVVQSLTAKIEDQMKSRSPSPKQVNQKMESNKEKITISIKPGSESIISSNSKQNIAKNDNKKVEQNESQQNLKTIHLPKTTKTEIPVRIGISSPLPPPVPPPIPPPEPQKISSPPKSKSKNQINSKLFHTKGWKSERVSRSGEVPTVKHVDPPTNVNVRDQLLNEIKSFGGKNSLKKVIDFPSKKKSKLIVCVFQVSNNSSWKLEINPLKT